MDWSQRYQQTPCAHERVGKLKRWLQKTEANVLYFEKISLILL